MLRFTTAHALRGAMIRTRKLCSSNLSSILARGRPQFREFRSPVAPSHSFATALESNPTNVYSDTSDCRTLNKRIINFVRNGRLDAARAVFDAMEHRTTVTWNSMLRGYLKRRELDKARKLFDEMPERDVVSWNLLLSGYIACRCLSEGRSLFDWMPERDSVSWNTMISGYARRGQMSEALCLFNSMPEPNIVTWNAMITGFFLKGDTSSAIEWFRRIPKRDATSVSTLVSGLVQNNELDNAAEILLECRTEDDGWENLLQACNTLIAGYGQRGRVDDARWLFDQIPIAREWERGDTRKRFLRNVVSWNSMIMCYVKSGDLISARSLFDEMTERDTFSWNTIISGYVNVLDMEEAFALFRRVPRPDTLTWNSMIYGFAQLGKFDLAWDFFEKIPKKSLATWNSMIAGYDKHKDFKKAIMLFAQMRVEGERPDRHTLSSLLSLCADSVNLQLGMQFHQQLLKTVIPDVATNNSLITMYSRCGAIAEAQTVFNDMHTQKDVISWNAMIGGYASHGYATMALELFEAMKGNKIRPTHITFISVLNACAHVGLVEEGQRHFASMVNEFGIEARIEHFALLVDILGRQGQLEEAINLIRSMPLEPDKTVWGALLSACRMHNNVELARVAAEALMKLEPESSNAYVLLYNIYADMGHWHDAAEVRRMMENNNIHKQRGRSWVGFTQC